MSGKNDLTMEFFASGGAWETWLRKHHLTSPGLWLKLAKKESGIRSMTYAEALDVALCYGWIDGQKNALDEQHWLQRFTPRRPKSKWSQINRSKAEALVKAGRMQAAGLKEMDAARQDGRWQAAYAPASTIEMPDDFAAALKQHPEAGAFFSTISKTNRYAILYRIHDAKKAETRERRIQNFIAMLLDRKTLY